MALSNKTTFHVFKTEFTYIQDLQLAVFLRIRCEIPHIDEKSADLHFLDMSVFCTRAVCGKKGLSRQNDRRFRALLPHVALARWTGVIVVLRAVCFTARTNCAAARAYAAVASARRCTRLCTGCIFCCQGGTRVLGYCRCCRMVVKGEDGQLQTERLVSREPMYFCMLFCWKARVERTKIRWTERKKRKEEGRKEEMGSREARSYLLSSLFCILKLFNVLRRSSTTSVMRAETRLCLEKIFER